MPKITFIIDGKKCIEEKDVEYGVISWVGACENDASMSIFGDAPVRDITAHLCIVIDHYLKLHVENQEHMKILRKTILEYFEGDILKCLK